MQSRERLVLAVTMCLATLLLALPAAAQESPSAEELAKANNPLASTKAFNMHNYFVPSLAGTEGSANTFWFRYAQPIGRVLVRASLPLPTVPVADQPDSISGVGDLNVFAAYLAVADAQTTLGIGPLLVAPSASDDALGSGKWQGGAAVVLFKVHSPTIQYGGLLTFQASIGGDDERADTSVLAAQPFLMIQLGGGTYLRSASVWVFDLENDAYNIPFGFGVGKVLKSGDTVYNVFIEPQFTMLHKGVGQPLFQLFSGLNLQF